MVAASCDRGRLEVTQTKSALVTGARGAIGRYVSRALASEGWIVAGIGRGQWEPSAAASWGVQTWHEADLSYDKLVGLNLRPNLIVHCAGSGAVGASVAAPYDDFARTVGATAAILEFIRVNCPEAVLVYPSSAAVYGIADHLPIAEASALHPASPYGVHKLCAEDLIAGHARLFHIRAAVVRLFSIYGEYFRKQILWDACNRIAADANTFFGTGRETRDFLHVSDAARLILTSAAHASTDCPIVNGGSGTSVSIEQLLVHLFELFGRKGRPHFSGAQRDGDPQHYQADISKARAWGWAPNIALDEGLRRYVTWYAQEQNPSVARQG
jgi:UDP-glucose 4-epimerase